MTEPWWKSAVIYQIYPRSFQDTDGDGVGDLPGIRRRLPYLAALGVDALWLSPIYPSPMADFGYDVACYTDVDPLFGTLDDADRLVAEAHSLGLKVILDFVPNHTSIAHPWFQDARHARTSVRRNWYIWRDPAPDGGPPNNWRSMFGGSAWTFDPQTEQYYYHAFLESQPDLNWREPRLREAMDAALTFWLDRGIDGFRIDVLWHLVKDAHFRDDPPDPTWRPGSDPYYALDHRYSCDQPGVHDLTRHMRALVERHGARVLIGEIYLPIPRLVAYYGAAGDGVHLPFNFHLLTTPWQAGDLADLIRRYEQALPPGAWPNWVLGNHDRPRLASRLGAAQAPVAAMLLLTLRGTPTLYYGDELGLTDVAIPPDAVQDPWEKNVPGLGLGRDPVRTPMAWDEGPGAGFTTGKPWLPLHPDHASRNVAVQTRTPGSLLSLYRRLLALRRASPALALGTIHTVTAEGSVLHYVREKDGQHVWVALNLASRPSAVSPPWPARLRLSTGPDPARDEAPLADALVLAAHEGIVAERLPVTPVSERQAL